MTSIVTAERGEQLHRLRDEVLDKLPTRLEQLDEAEQQLRAGMQRLATASLQGWAETASTASPPPKCPGCGVPMRHRGVLDGMRAYVGTRGGGKSCRWGQARFS